MFHLRKLITVLIFVALLYLFQFSCNGDSYVTERPGAIFLPIEFSFQKQRRSLSDPVLKEISHESGCELLKDRLFPPFIVWVFNQVNPVLAYLK